MKREDVLKRCARHAALLGIVGFGAVLVSRKNKFSCTDQCGRCEKFKHGKCALGIK